VIAHDPATDQPGRLAAGHTEEQHDLAKLSTNSKFVIAEGSRHDVPLARPDVIVEAVRGLIKPQVPVDSRGTP
jgi:pimeloyl-ACP methyl ester carboxylesterase